MGGADGGEVGGVTELEAEWEGEGRDEAGAGWADWDRHNSPEEPVVSSCACLWVKRPPSDASAKERQVFVSTGVAQLARPPPCSY
jgi:hypothetical protein